MNSRPFNLQGKRIFVAGHNGMAGSAIVRRLSHENCQVLTADRNEVNLVRQVDVENWFADNRPDAVFLAAAKVGGIHANDTRPAEFLYENLIIESNIIHAAYRARVKKLLFLGSSCIYPREANMPIKEEALLTGPLEPTNEAYAVAKIAGIKLCQSYRRQYGCDFITAMPPNLYGPKDRYDLEQGHVVAALIMKIHAAAQRGDKTVTIWGTGTPKREFLFTEDLADGLTFLMKNYSEADPINLGTGSDITIQELASAIAAAAGWDGEFIYDTSKPDGMPRKVMDIGRLSALGWQAPTRFDDGIRVAYAWYANNVANQVAGETAD